MNEIPRFIYLRGDHATRFLFARVPIEKYPRNRNAPRSLKLHLVDVSAVRSLGLYPAHRSTNTRGFLSLTVILSFSCSLCLFSLFSISLFSFFCLSLNLCSSSFRRGVPATNGTSRYGKGSDRSLALSFCSGSFFSHYQDRREGCRDHRDQAECTNLHKKQKRTGQRPQHAR